MECFEVLVGWECTTAELIETIFFHTSKWYVVNNKPPLTISLTSKLTSVDQFTCLNSRVSALPCQLYISHAFQNFAVVVLIVSHVILCSF